MRKILRSAAALGTLALLAACSESTGPDRGDVGSVRFTYSGARSGTFEAEGRFGGGLGLASAWAVGIRGAGMFGPVESVVVVANDPAGAGTADVFTLMLPELQPGTYTCDVDSASVEGCLIFGDLLLGQDVRAPVSGDGFFVTGITLRIDAASRERMRGSFSAVAERFEDGAVVTIQNGEFDVPIRDADRSVIPVFSRAAEGRPRR